MENNKQQTGLDWYITKRHEIEIESRLGHLPPDEYDEELKKAERQAKEMEKEQNKITENTSDGYHTFKELYDFRKAYNVALFNEWGRKGLIPNPNGSYHSKCYVHKSWKHHDGELCFGGGWFIVVAVLPTGQISNHYKTEDWDLFQIPETEKALFEFDGHTGQDVIDRLLHLSKRNVSK
jgi:hypothetical protein